MHVCQTAVDTLAIADDFPENCSCLPSIEYRMLTIKGIMKHRKAGKIPTGEKITLLKVGGRTSAMVPSLQKKTGGTADGEEKPKKEKAEKAPKSAGSAKKRKVKEEDDEPVKAEKAAKVEGTRRRSARNG
jgi:formamidopyrimidine-DNA glycosylase